MKKPTKSPLVSIIIVHFKAQKEILDCIRSIKKSRPKANYEIIIVDNEKSSQLKKNLTFKFRNFTYIKSPSNLGFAAANNLGAKKASGKYLFFLNPDTLVHHSAIDTLVTFLKKHSLSVAAPFLLNRKDHPYKLQGTSKLTPLTAIFSLSFLNKHFPNNPIARKYWLKDIKKDKPFATSVLPGTAFMLSKNLFNQVGGFDDNFFLYFEESDICLRLQRLGAKLFILPKARVTHFWETSTKKVSSYKINQYFASSRYYYFRKHYGLISAFMVELVSSLGKNHLIFLLTISLAAFLRFYKLEQLAPFIGDQARDFLAAKDAIISGQLPLLGGQSSVPRFNHGPLYIWLLIPVLRLFNFDPAPAIFMAGSFGLLAVGFVYIVANKFFSKSTAAIAALFLATSPLAVAHSRLALHPNAVPLMSIIYLWSLIKLTKKQISLFWVSLIFALTWQFELSVTPLVLLIPISYYLSNRIPKKKDIIDGLLGLTLGFLPQIVYDITNNFKQLGLFITWVGFRLVSFITPASEHSASLKKIDTTLHLSGKAAMQLVAWDSGPLAIIVTVLVFLAIKNSFTQRSNLPAKLLSYWIIIMFISFFILGQTSDIYFATLFVPISILIGIQITSIKPKFYQRLAIFGMIALAFINSNFLLSHQFLVKASNPTKVNYGTPLGKQIRVAKTILEKTQGPINLKGTGINEVSKNYRYLFFFLAKREIDQMGTTVWIQPKEAVKPQNSITYYIDNTTISFPLNAL